MRNLIILVILAVTAFQVWDKLGHSVAPKFDGPYVAVYGRDSCGFTKRMLADLDSSGITYHYFSVDEKNIADDLHARMEGSGISTRRYNLPVVDVSGEISVRPKSKDVLDEYSL